MTNKRNESKNTQDEHTEAVVPTFRDRDRNGSLTLHGLGRWSNLSTKILMKSILSRDWGFLLAAHTTFDSLRARFEQSTWSLPGNKRFQKSGYYTEYNRSSFYSAKHIYKSANIDSFIGHEILLSVAINRETRKPKALSQGFKALIDSMWSYYPQKQKYVALKNVLLDHLNELKQIRMSDMNKLLYSYKMQLRYCDEDRNHHLNSRTYYKMIEEMLMNYDVNIANGKHLNYSISLVYWHETPVSKYSHCFVSICKRNGVYMKNDKTGKYHKAWDVYGLISVSQDCQRNADRQQAWIQQTGFVVRVVDRKALKKPTVAKL